VKAYTDPGDVVYDPFGGSGSTLLAAAQEGRQGVMVELSAAYCDLICARFETRTGVRAVRESDGFSPAFVKVPEEISETG
jgi:DNA modification methylase